MDSRDFQVQIDELDQQQNLCVQCESTRLCIIAPAGSGKTRVIIKRIEHLCKTNKVLPSQIVAITFTRKAGFELAQRLAKTFDPEMRDRPIVSTLHSFALSELRTYHLDNNTKIRAILENPVQILEDLKSPTPSKMARAISWCKTRLMSPEDVSEESMRAIRRHTHLNPRTIDLETFVKLFKLYQLECKKKHVMDHDEVLVEYCLRLGNQEYANSRRYLYRHLFVDEFQDTTPLHMEIYRRLVGETGAMTVVGDPNQSIFSFAGSSNVYLNNFTDYFPGSECIYLSTNYRSTRANVEVSRSVIEKQDSNKVFSNRSSKTLPRVHVFPDAQSEADGIVDIVSKSHASGVSLSDIAVLVRTNSQKDEIVEAAKRLGIKFSKGRHTITDPVAASIWRTIVALRKKRNWKSIYDALDDIDNAQTLTGDLDNEHKDLFRNLRKSAREYLDLFPHDRYGDVNGFFEYIETKLSNEEGSKKGFAILTFHQAKGLEFHTVIVSGFEQGLVPLYSDKIRKKEEARLAYVALSRATDELHITRASVRIRHDSPVVQKPSEFLDIIKGHIAQIDIRDDQFTTNEAFKRIADIRAKYLIKKP